MITAAYITWLFVNAILLVSFSVITVITGAERASKNLTPIGMKLNDTAARAKKRKKRIS